MSQRSVFGLLAAAAAFASAGTAAAQAPGLATMCKDRKPCTLVKTTPAGADAQGRAISVIELNLGKKNPENDGGDERFNCRPFKREFWVRVAGGPEPQRFLSLCNDGYGSAGIGEDDITIRANRFVHSQQGGSAWRWNNGKTVQLSPLRVLSEESCSYHNVNIGYSLTRWDWQKFSGDRRWLPQACKENDPRANKEIDWCDARKATHRHALIPRLDGAMPAGAPAHLGSCASAFDESGQKGFVTFGKPRAGGAEFRALMISGRDLLVTMSDTAFVTGGASWLNDDHVELWLGQERSNLSCDETKLKLAQWAVTLDGKVHHAAGDSAFAPELVARNARTAAGRQQVTLHIRLQKLDENEEDYLRGLTVVYSKAEGGKQARLSATTPFKRGDETTLGSINKIDAKAARCAVKDGQLDIVESGRPEILGD